MQLLSQSSSRSDLEGFEAVDTLPLKRKRVSSEVQEQHDNEASVDNEVIVDDRQFSQSSYSQSNSTKENKCKVARDRLWEKMFDLLMDYEKQNGHCKFPLSFKVIVSTFPVAC